jgi:AcrR family transcriptional regulator
MSRHSQQNWLHTGLKILGQEGQAGLTIDAMAADLERTKGSFYHHFGSMANFEQQLVDYWAEQYLTTSEHLPDDPQVQLALLDQIMAEAFFTVTEPELAIRTWAQQNARVRTRVEQVDNARRRFVQRVFQALTHNETLSRRMADMLLALLIGSLTAMPRYTSAQVQALYAEFKRLYELDDLATRQA